MQSGKIFVSWFPKMIFMFLFGWVFQYHALNEQRESPLSAVHRLASDYKSLVDGPSDSDFRMQTSILLSIENTLTCQSGGATFIFRVAKTYSSSWCWIRFGLENVTKKWSIRASGGITRGRYVYAWGRGWCYPCRRQRTIGVRGSRFGGWQLESLLLFTIVQVHEHREELFVNFLGWGRVTEQPMGITQIVDAR